MVKLVMRVARVAPKRARCFNSKGTSFHVVLELEHVKPVDQRSAIRKADAVLPAFARAGQRHDTLKRVAQRGRCRLLYLFGVKHVDRFELPSTRGDAIPRKVSSRAMGDGRHGQCDSTEHVPFSDFYNTERDKAP